GDAGSYIDLNPADATSSQAIGVAGTVAVGDVDLVSGFWNLNNRVFTPFAAQSPGDVVSATNGTTHVGYSTNVHTAIAWNA
ncbi:hypothetical protein ACSTIX_24345, partial [Vibrio parahaemolyticus]